MPKHRVLYGLRVNCAKQGCNPVHGDDGEILERDEAPDKATINGHAADIVRQIVTLSDWEVME